MEPIVSDISDISVFAASCLLAVTIATVAALSWLRFHPLAVLLLSAFTAAACSGLGASGVDAVAEGLGSTVGSVGIIVVEGAVIGQLMDSSGAAEVIADTLFKATRSAGVAPTLAVLGLLVSVSVFADVGYIILVPLAKIMAHKSGTAMSTCALSLALGLSASHTLVPPTPGPVLAAAQLDANLGLVLGLGACVAMTSSCAGVVFAASVAPRLVPDSALAPSLPAADATAGVSPGDGRASQKRQASSGAPPASIAATGPPFHAEEAGCGPRVARHRPSPWLSVAPTVMPLCLIVLQSIAVLPSQPMGSGAVKSVVAFVGAPSVALLLGAAIAFRLPQRKQSLSDMVSQEGILGKAVTDSAPIIMITGAGGALGHTLNAAGVGSALAGALARAHMGIWLPILLASALKIAQGSGTVSISVTSTLVAPFLPELGLTSPIHRALVVVAIGAGALIMPGPNDSFFWVVVKFTGLTMKQGLQLLTTGTALVGCTAAVVVALMAWNLTATLVGLAVMCGGVIAVRQCSTTRNGGAAHVPRTEAPSASFVAHDGFSQLSDGGGDAPLRTDGRAMDADATGGGVSGVSGNNEHDHRGGDHVVTSVELGPVDAASMDHTPAANDVVAC